MLNAILQSSHLNIVKVSLLWFLKCLLVDFCVLVVVSQMFCWLIFVYLCVLASPSTVDDVVRYDAVVTGEANNFGTVLIVSLGIGERHAGECVESAT